MQLTLLVKVTHQCTLKRGGAFPFPRQEAFPTQRADLRTRVTLQDTLNIFLKKKKITVQTFNNQVWVHLERGRKETNFVGGEQNLKIINSDR